VNQPQLSLYMSVAQIQQTWPETVGVFNQFKTACIGCYLQRFCTLQVVADYYNLDSETLLEALRHGLHITQSTRSTS
jgi:hypothetical protein